MSIPKSFNPTLAWLLAAIVFSLPLMGCSDSGPELEVDYMHLFGAPVLFEIRNRGREPVTIQRVVVNADVELTNSQNGFEAVTLAQGESVAVENLKSRAVELTVYTDQGAVAWEIE